MTSSSEDEPADPNLYGTHTKDDGLYRIAQELQALRPGLDITTCESLAKQWLLVIDRCSAEKRNLGHVSFRAVGGEKNATLGSMLQARRHRLGMPIDQLAAACDWVAQQNPADRSR